MKKSPNIITVDYVRSELCGNTTIETDKGWCVARPLGYTSLFYRLKATWMVFTGKADALVWPNKQ